MYPFGSLTAELQSARRKLLDVFEVPDSMATGERRTQGMRNGLERWLHPDSQFALSSRLELTAVDRPRRPEGFCGSTLNRVSSG